MDGVEPEVVEQADRVGGHVRQPVGRVHLFGVTTERLQELGGEVEVGCVDLRRQADVAVVVADDVEAAIDEGRAQVDVPLDGL